MLKRFYHQLSSLVDDFKRTIFLGQPYEKLGTYKMNGISIDLNDLSATESTRYEKFENMTYLVNKEQPRYTMSLILLEQTAKGFMFFDGEEISTSDLTVSKCIDKINLYIDTKMLKVPHIPQNIQYT